MCTVLFTVPCVLKAGVEDFLIAAGKHPEMCKHTAFDTMDSRYRSPSGTPSCG